MALHADEQHEAFKGIIAALEFERARHYASVTPPAEDEAEFLNLQIYYPLVVLSGRLYAATLRSGKVSLRPAKHLQYRREVVAGAARTEKLPN